jgi:hypothetical protein
MDVFKNLTPASTLRFRIPIFAETEVDARQVNLTRFPLFSGEAGVFPWKEARFEVAGLRPRSEADLIPFFSRRIGLLEERRCHPRRHQARGKGARVQRRRFGRPDSRDRDRRPGPRPGPEPPRCSSEPQRPAPVWVGGISLAGIPRTGDNNSSASTGGSLRRRSAGQEPEPRSVRARDQGRDRCQDRLLVRLHPRLSERALGMGVSAIRLERTFARRSFGTPDRHPKVPAVLRLSPSRSRDWSSAVQLGLPPGSHRPRGRVLDWRIFTRLSIFAPNPRSTSNGTTSPSFRGWICPSRSIPEWWSSVTTAGTGIASEVNTATRGRGGHFAWWWGASTALASPARLRSHVEARCPPAPRGANGAERRRAEGRPVPDFDLRVASTPISLGHILEPASSVRLGLEAFGVSSRFRWF